MDYKKRQFVALKHALTQAKATINDEKLQALHRFEHVGMHDILLNEDAYMYERRQIQNLIETIHTIQKLIKIAQK